VAALIILAIVRPRAAAQSLAASAWLTAVALTAAAGGFAIGAARVNAIDAGALDLAPGTEVVVRGFVIAAPSISAGKVAIRIETVEGRLQIDVPPPASLELSTGDAVRASGVIRDPSAFERERLARLGIRNVLAARAIEVQPGRRSGIAGVLDEIRARAERALTDGTPAATASLLLGFVLGQEEGIAETTVDDFKVSGLAHLLAVSGQNIVLLAILAGTVLAVVGVGARARLLWILVLIAVYVPVAGAGPSIQRAGVMGAAGLVAALAGRPRSGWYALLLAAVTTLALDPRATADIGWQLSFSAVAGLLLAARPLAVFFAGDHTPGWRRALAEGGAVTAAATLATAPLMAHHFETASLVSLPANLAVLPAVAPVMWLGMAAATAGQLPLLPVEPLTWLAGLLAAFISQIASWFAQLPGAQATVGLSQWWAVAAAYAGLGLALGLAKRWAGRRRRLRAPQPRSKRSRRLLLTAAAFPVVAAIVAFVGWTGPPGAPDGAVGLRITVLDVGQGDSILLQPADGGPILVDTGPPGAEIVTQLERHGVEELAALAITHPDLDHDGEAVELLRGVEVERFLFARADLPTLAAARAVGTKRIQISAGSAIRSGSLRIEVLWPPPQALAVTGPPTEPNNLSLVMVARWRAFEILLNGDAESETVPIDAGDVDVLKLAHHGSEDQGLAGMLAETNPELAVISVGAANTYGHPTTETLGTLAEANVAVRRTDLEGEIAIDVTNRGWSLR